VDQRNAVEDDELVVPVFSRSAAGPTHIPIPAGVGGLDHDSVLFAEEITTLDLEFSTRGRMVIRYPTNFCAPSL
jgi:mRNA-degrading endonuclease toxin of MazEF toxin-antitoxin module